MKGVEKIAVVGFSNFTVDPGLGILFGQIVATTLRDFEHYEVVDSTAAKTALAKLGVTVDQLADPKVAQSVGKELGVDALITGAASYYFEDTSLSVPECIRCYTEGRSPYWLVSHRTTVFSTFQAQVIRTGSGAIIWSNVMDGREETNRTIYLDWSETDPPPYALVPETDRSDIPATREASVREASRQFTQDLLPRYIWVRKDK